MRAAAYGLSPMSVVASAKTSEAGGVLQRGEECAGGGETAVRGSGSTSEDAMMCADGKLRKSGVKGLGVEDGRSGIFAA